MDGRYDIFMGNQVVGAAVVQQQGLYYRFQCRCRLPKDYFCRVTVECDGRHESLGTLLPAGDGYCLTTRLAAKKLGQGKPRFCIVPKAPAGRFIPVYPDEPFAYLTQLKNAYLEERRGQVGVVIPD